MNKNNLSILKLIIFQTSFLLMNLEKNCLDLRDLNWFYQFYQVFFFKIVNYLKLNNKDFNNFFLEKNMFKNKKDFYNLYVSMYNYIEEKKNDYDLLTV